MNWMTVNKYNNTFHKTIKMKPVDVKSNKYISSSKDINDKDPKFKVSDTVRISKYKNVFTKAYTPNMFEKKFVIKKVKGLSRGHMLLVGLNGEEIVGKFYEKKFKKLNQKESEVEKVMKGKGDKLYAK